MRKKRVVSLDVVRLFACICITIVHFNAQISGFDGTQFVYQNSITPNHFIENRLYLGGIGVSLFFMLTGSTLMMTYKEGNLRNYYIKRFLNIFPMFYVAYIAATVVDFFVYKSVGYADLRLLCFSLLGMDGYLASLGWIPFDFYKIGEWFLGCLLLLYAIFPLLHFGLKRNIALTCVCVIAIYLGYSQFAFRLGWNYTDKAIVLKFPEILLGMLFVKYNLREKPKTLLGITVTTAIVAYLLRNSISNTTFTTAMCMLLFAVLVIIGEQIKNERVSELLAKIAGLTYPVFLVHHWLILKLIRGFDLAYMRRRNICFMFIVYIGLTLFLAYVLNRFTDKMMRRIRNSQNQK